ncbi:ESPR-type extended signal peptide-containing protein [Phascolarctobacterium succinatutens]|uniref:ESPR-type extended signal peptide-containing protein n=1 Tax=Phascolarctobacterium succinatutens TaxID=626940 RepID=UPI0040250FF5
MNKVFKVIWSEARNAYVVVSEIAKNHGSKSCSTKKLLAMLIATGVMTCASMAPAMADNPAAEALKHSTVTAGYNITVTPKDNSDGGKEYNVDLKNDIYLAGDDPDAMVSISGSKGTIWTSSSVTAGSVAVGTAKADGTTPFFVNSNGAFYGANGSFVVDKDGKVTATAGEIGNVVLQNGVFTGHSALRDGKLFVGDASGNYSQITTKGAKLGKVTVAVDGKISGVAAGAITADSTDAVNGSQLHAVATEAGKHSKVVSGNNINVEETDVDGQKFYKVNMNKDIMLGDLTGKNVSISGTNGTIEATGYIATKDRVYADKGAKLADIDVTGDTISNGDAKLALNGAAGTAGMINGKGASVYMQDGYTVINSKVAFDQNGKISGVAAGAVTADSTDAVNGSQLHAVATEAGKHSKVVSGNNINVEETDVDGQKFYKVNMNKDIMLGDLTGKNVSISGTNGTIEATGYIATKDRVYADKGAKLADIDVTGDTISNGDAKLALNGAAGTAGMINGKGASVYMQDGYTVINSKVAFDQNGKISGVAAGAVTADSTDAVNGSQLHAVATEAGKHTTLSNGKNTTVTSTNKDGQVDYQVNVAGDLKDITSVSNGDSKINLNADSISISNGNKSFAITNSGIGMSYITADYSTKSIMLGENGTTISGGLNVAGSKITGVAAGVADTDAVNVGQLKEAVEAGNTDTHIKPGEYGVGADNTVKMDVVDKNGNKVDTVTIKDVAKASDVGDVNNIANDIKNKEGKTTVVDAVNNLNNKVGDLQYSKVEKGDIADGDSTTTAIGKLDQKLTDVAATAAKHTKVEGSSNIIVTNTAKEGEAANYQVKLNETIDVNTVTANSVTTGQTVMNNDGLKVGKDVSVTATAVTAGKTSISDEGVKVGDKTYISDKGLNANGQNITNVADGKVEKDSKDAINGGQLHQAKADINNRIDGVENQVVSNTNRINQLGSRVNKVGAGAAALAALHPMDFDPDDKLTFSAGYGNYGGENAAAIGAYYRPDEKVMFSVGGTVGNGENMVNAGVSFSLDRTNHVSNSRTAMAREILDLRAEVTELKAMVAKGGLGSIAEDKMKIFPDVAENHWAYEYVGKLAAAGIIEGYPDGNFSGDRMMSRYEFAAMLYRAMQKGAQLDSKIINEFAPEMGRIRVDRISGEDGDRDKIERVRVNAVKGERDHYGNKLAK